jgi:hypothetical protein
MAARPESPRRRATRAVALRSVAKSVMWRAAPSLFRRWQKPFRQEFAIGIYTGPALTRLASPAGAANPVLTRMDVTDLPAGFVADPFLCRVDGRWYMFFEVMDAITQKGVIAVATSEDGLCWVYDRVVLSEPVHLSYPYVFEGHGEFFMIPESRQSHSVRLYRAVSFPHRWELACTLFDQVPFVDSSIMHFEGKWWIFAAAIQPEGGLLLLLHYADDLFGPWRAHRANPIVGDTHFLRPAGRVVLSDESLVRFAQSGYPAYGTEVQALRILELSPTQYAEERLQTAPILGPGAGWISGGMHHIDAQLSSNGSWIASVDGWPMTSRANGWTPPKFD